MNKPIPSNLVFGRLLSEGEYCRSYGECGLSYPPLAGEECGCVFNLESRGLVSNVWGRLVCEEDGLRIQPAWQVGQGGTTLSVEVELEDCLGCAVTMGRLLRAMPPGLEGVTIDRESLLRAFARAEETGGPVRAVVARGRTPRQGRDARLEMRFTEMKLNGALREDGTMDFRERGGLNFVNRGDVLAVLYPCEPGQPGCTIFGDELPSPEPRDVDVSCGEGVSSALREDGTVRYCATRDGVAYFANNGFVVRELLEVPGDVDMKTGNIRSKGGTVVVGGSVLEGFAVEAPGDIVVGDIVEDAVLHAGGSISVAGGVAMCGGKAIRAGEDLAAKFCQNAVVETGGNVVVQSLLSHCEVCAGGMVTVVGAGGVVSGGRVVCGKGLEVDYLGNEARSRTVVELRFMGSLEDALLEQRNELVAELERLEKAIGGGDALEILQGAPDEDRRVVAELLKIRAHLHAGIRAVDDKIVQGRNDADEHLAGARVKVRRKAYAGVEVVVGNKKFKVTEDMNAPVFKWDVKRRLVVAQ